MAQSILRLPQVKARVGLSRAWIYKLIRKGEFPRPIKISSSRCVGWPESSIDAWIENQIEQNNTVTE